MTRTRETVGIAEISTAVAAIAAGGMVIVVDDPDRENEGDFVMAADAVTPESVNFMATHGRGLICVPMTGERLAGLHIPPAVDENTDPKQTAFHVSVDLRTPGSTGISASDRARTILALAGEGARSADFTRPGHVFPLRSMAGGVLERAGHTEAAVDLAMLAGRRPAGVICEICRADGEMARLPELLEIGLKHDIPVVTISDLISYRRARSRIIEWSGETQLPLPQGAFRAVGFRDSTGDEHVALVLGDVASHPRPLVRMHLECLTGDVFGSRRCACRTQLVSSLEIIGDAGCGAVVYLRGHGAPDGGHVSTLAGYARLDAGLDVIEPMHSVGHVVHARDYEVGAEILHLLGIRRMRLLTGGQPEWKGGEIGELEIIERISLLESHPHNVRHLPLRHLPTRNQSVPDIESPGAAGGVVG